MKLMLLLVFDYVTVNQQFFVIKYSRAVSRWKHQATALSLSTSRDSMRREKYYATWRPLAAGARQLADDA